MANHFRPQLTPMKATPISTLSALALFLCLVGSQLGAATTVPAAVPNSDSMMASPAIAPAVSTSGVNGYSSLANILTLPAATPGAAPAKRLGSSAFIWEKFTNERLDRDFAVSSE